jgi:dihydrofolate synthase/folylpolyglutamate synthase
MDIGEALGWLGGHINLEADTSARAAGRRLDRTARLAAILGDPQHAYPVIHLTGTNGKGSTARMITQLLMAKGLTVGTYTSPDLERVNERLAWNGEPIGDEPLAATLEAISHVEGMLEGPPTYFEILTVAAFSWFAEIAVDVAVIEVGLGGRWDSTNIADGRVAVVTNVELDHVEVIGPDRRSIAIEKAGIVKPGSTLVLGETDPDLEDVFLDTPAGKVWRRGTDFGCDRNEIAHGGRLLDLRTPGARYPAVYLPLHGGYQAENAAVALAAAEAFFDAPIEPELVAEAFASVKNPGRMEVVGRQPLVLLDGAHNPAGARAAARTLVEEFGTVPGRVLVVGLNKGREPAEMLAALDVERARFVIACPTPSPRSVPPADIAAAAEAVGAVAEVAASPEAAVRRALALADPEELVFVTGSLYVVGSVRAALRGAPHH